MKRTIISYCNISEGISVRKKAIMATRLATTRNNFITVTPIKNEDESDTNNSTITTNNSSEVQRTQITPVALHHVNLSQVSDFFVET